MITWIILLVFGVPFVVVILQAIRRNKEHNASLEEVRRRISEKQQEAIETKLADIKKKRISKPNKPGNGNDSSTET